MKAAQINEYGGSEVLKLNPDAPKPTPKDGQVLVEVYAAAVNPWDNKVRDGSVKDFISLAFPATLGGDVAGVVSELGPGVQGFEVGREVFGQANASGGEGSYAEFTPVKAESLAIKPKSIDFLTAAAVPLAAASAYQALVEHINLQAGQKILIHGGAGGIGSYAVQIAKALGAYVATTVSGKDEDFAKSLGADEVIDYQKHDFTNHIKDYDAVFDTAGGDTALKSYPVLKSGGILVSMAAEPDEDLAKSHGITAIHQSTKVTTDKLEALAKMIDSGQLKVAVDKVFPLERAGDAQAQLESGGHRGKIVIRIKG